MVLSSNGRGGNMDIGFRNSLYASYQQITVKISFQVCTSLKFLDINKVQNLVAEVYQKARWIIVMIYFTQHQGIQKMNEDRVLILDVEKN